MEASFDIRIDWADQDLFGHVNNLAFFRYMQAARVNLGSLCGLDFCSTTKVPAPMLAASSCQFKSPLFFPGMVRVVSRVSFVKESSFGLVHHLYNDQGILAATGEDVIVAYDFGKQTKISIPDWLREKLEGVG